MICNYEQDTPIWNFLQNSISEKTRGRTEVVHKNFIVFSLLAPDMDIRKDIIEVPNCINNKQKFYNLTNLETVHINDQTLVQYIKNSKNIKPLMQYSKLFRVHFQELNEVTWTIVGRIDMIEKCKNQLYESIEQGQRGVDYYDLESAFHLSLLKKYFMYY